VLIIVIVATATACGGGDGADGPTTGETGTMQLRSSAYGDGASIPAVYTCDGEDVSPPFTIEGVPDGTESLILVMDDPDAPSGVWVHWVAYDIPVTDVIPERTAVGTQGANSWGRLGYGGPCPPSGTHRYVTTVYALRQRLGVVEGARTADVLAAMEGLVVDSATLVGTYGR
jgi:Raf kinase inhibitor-like YbhB/YbcL family protein